jgi:mRNA interferase HigB
MVASINRDPWVGDRYAFMHVISRKKLREFSAVHPDAETALQAWFKIARKARWTGPSAVQGAFGRRVDQVVQFTIFDIGGNKYRLIAVIDFDRQKVFIRNVLTHKEYDTDKWKDDRFRVQKRG